MKRRFVETRGFSTHRERLERAGELSHDDMVRLEQDLLANPAAGDMMKGCGGLRKVRLGQKSVGRGKRGVVRVCYLDLERREVTYLVAIFGKREQSDLTATERRAVAEMVRHIKEDA